MSTTSEFGYHSTAEQVAKHFAERCKGKHIMVTGANTGLGEETARALAAHGAIVTLTSRSVANGEAAIAAIKAKHPDAQVSLLQMDLSELASVKKAAETYLARGEPLHILINNAGVMACPRTMTKDGLESQFGVNHIGHFYFTTLLLNLLEQTGTPEEPARVINLSSMGNYLFAPKEGIVFDDINGSKHYNSWTRYGQSKLANILFTRELDRRMKAENRNVISVSLHPGAILGTDLKRHMGLLNTFSGFLALKRGMMIPAFTDGNKSIPMGSSTTVVAALDPNIERAAHYANCQVDTIKVHARASDEVLAKRLWDWSDEFVRSKML